MKFVLKPSLQHMILVKIVVALWNHNDVRNLIIMRKVHFTSDFTYKSEIWKKIEDKVIEKVPLLSLPHLLKEKVLGFIKPIGAQILEWIKFHSFHFNLRLNLPAEFCWTPEGTIDRKKTAELLIKDDHLDTDARYKLACIYCFEDDIKIFWKNMPEIVKESISTKPRIINFWTRSMRGRRLDYISYGPEFHQSLCLNNVVGAAYFLPKLTQSEREHYMGNTAQFVRDPDILCFLLSEMEDEQQTEFFKKNPSRVLNCFLQWPLQSYFFEVANCIWEFLSVESYNDVLRSIVTKVNHGYKDWNYQRIFSEFWLKCPNTLKNLVANDIDKSGLWLLPTLCHVKDKENIILVLKDVTPANREKVFSNVRMNFFCQRSILANEWDFLEFCIREAFPSKNEMLKFKEEFEKSPYITSEYFKEHFARNKQKWDQIFIYPDDSLSMCEKRGLEEGECSSFKRFSNDICLKQG